MSTNMTHKDVLLEALSALMGIPLKNSAEDLKSAAELDIFNFIPIVTGNYSNIPGYLDLSGGCPKELSVNLEKFLDPRFNHDYTNEKDLTCMRGGESYTRPCGWSRIALKVLDKYPDGNTWLGTAQPKAAPSNQSASPAQAGSRKDSVVGEWPVSYHGTSFKGAIGITKSNFEPGSGKAYGRGIYSTPKIQVAQSYSKEFKSKTNGKTYRVLMQNRINPQMRKECDKEDYWLIEIPEGTSSEKAKEIVEKSIRPYGILLKEKIK